MLDNFIGAVKDGLEAQSQPAHILHAGRDRRVALLDTLFVPAQSAGVGLAFHTSELSIAFEARASVLAKMILLHRLEGPTCQLLHDQAVQVIAKPRVSKLGSVAVQVVLPKATGSPSFCKRLAARLPAVHRPRLLIDP